MTYPLFEQRFDDHKVTREGTHRVVPLEVTLERCLTLMKPAGITRLADITGLDVIGMPVYVAHRPLSRSLSVAQGKGITPLAAKVSALMESLECWAAETITTPLTYATTADLDAQPIIERLETRCPFDEGQTIPWLPAWHLGTRTWAWLPYELATMDMVGIHRIHCTFNVGSNGLSSGNNLLEAVLHGIYEVVERHNCEIWRHAGAPLQVLDPTTIRCDAYQELLRTVAAAGVRFASFVVDGSVDVPTFCSVVWDEAGAAEFSGGGVGYGYGSHAESDVALLRAATEALQSRLTYITGTREDMARSDYEIAHHPDRAQSLQADCENADLVEWEPRHASDSLSLDLEDLMHRLDDAGLPDVFAFDLSKPKLGLAVAKVVIPGAADEGTYE